MDIKKIFDEVFGTDSNSFYSKTLDISSTNSLLERESKALQELKNSEEALQAAKLRLRKAEYTLNAAKEEYLEVRQLLEKEGIRPLPKVEKKEE